MSNVRVFGSFARGTATEKSDADLLVAAEPGRSMLDVIGLWLDLEDLLKCKVDLITQTFECRCVAVYAPGHL
jgi:predicted nucleotidyltransferase